MALSQIIWQATAFVRETPTRFVGAMREPVHARTLTEK